jgi:hypothetical protein
MRMLVERCEGRVIEENKERTAIFDGRFQTETAYPG